MANYLKLSGIIGSTFQIDKTSATPGSIITNYNGLLAILAPGGGFNLAPLGVGLSSTAAGLGIAANLEALAAKSRLDGGFQAPTFASNPVNGSSGVRFLICTENAPTGHEWLADTFTYASGDYVSYNGSWYVNSTGVNTTTAPQTDTTNWTPYSTNGTSDGWSNGIIYAISAKVWYSGRWWINNTAGTLTGDQPGNNTTQWTLQGDHYGLGDIALDTGSGSGATLKIAIQNGDFVSASTAIAAAGVAWSNTTSYPDGSRVTYNGAWYVNLSGSPSVGDQPNTNPNIWAQYSGQSVSLLSGTAYIYTQMSGFSALLAGYTGIAKAIRVPFAFGDIAGGTLASTATIPNGATILRSRVGVYTPFTAAATVSVGYTGVPTLLQTTADNDLQTSGNYIVEDTSTGGGWSSTLPVLLTFTGTAVAGTGYVLVEYVTPDA